MTEKQNNLLSHGDLDFIMFNRSDLLPRMAIQEIQELSDVIRMDYILAKPTRMDILLRNIQRLCDHIDKNNNAIRKSDTLKKRFRENLYDLKVSLRYLVNHPETTEYIEDMAEMALIMIRSINL